MKIEYNDGKMIVTHTTGIINEYDKADILRQRHAVELEILAANDELKHFDGIMSEMDKSVTKPTLLAKISKLITRKG